MLFLTNQNFGTPADTQPRLSLQGSAAPAILFGPGGSTAADLYVRRSAAKTLIVDADGAGGALTTVDFKTTNLYQNGSPITAVATQVQRASGVAGDYVAEIKLTADTNYRLFTGLDSSSNPIILMGGGSAAADVRIYRVNPGVIYYDSNAAAIQVEFDVVASTGQTALIGVATAADSYLRVALNNAGSISFGTGSAVRDVMLQRTAAGAIEISSNGAAAATLVSQQSTSGQINTNNLEVAGDTAGTRLSLRGDATLTGILMGSGTAADLHFRRSAAKTLELDTDGALGALTLVDVRATSFNWNGLPVSQAVGQVVTVNFVIDGGGSAITTGIKGDLVLDFACTIDQVTLLADQSGSIVIDIWKQTYASFPPTVTQTITASDLPTLSSASKYQDATLTGWTTAIAAGSVLRFNVNSATTVQRVTLSLKVTRT